ncbi:MAG TPA: hypothetical protein VGC41_22050, partial [Kofleriaceae bacterium]
PVEPTPVATPIEEAPIRTDPSTPNVETPLEPEQSPTTTPKEAPMEAPSTRDAPFPLVGPIVDIPTQPPERAGTPKQEKARAIARQAATRPLTKQDRDKRKKKRRPFIKWPQPIWRNKAFGVGDTGSKSAANDRPATMTVKKIQPHARNTAMIRRYRAKNEKVIDAVKEPGQIHHKHPLYLSGPDNETNLVFLRNQDHIGWHQTLTVQTSPYPIGTIFDVI